MPHREIQKGNRPEKKRDLSGYYLTRPHLTLTNNVSGMIIRGTIDAKIQVENETVNGVNTSHPNVRDVHLYPSTSTKTRLLSAIRKQLKLTEAMQSLLDQVNQEDSDEDSQEGSPPTPHTLF